MILILSFVFHPPPARAQHVALGGNRPVSTLRQRNRSAPCMLMTFASLLITAPTKSPLFLMGIKARHLKRSYWNISWMRTKFETLTSIVFYILQKLWLPLRTWHVSPLSWQQEFRGTASNTFSQQLHCTFSQYTRIFTQTQTHHFSV